MFILWNGMYPIPIQLIHFLSMEWVKTHSNSICINHQIFQIHIYL